MRPVTRLRPGHGPFVLLTSCRKPTIQPVGNETADELRLLVNDPARRAGNAVGFNAGRPSLKTIKTAREQRLAVHAPDNQRRHIDAQRVVDDHQAIEKIGTLDRQRPRKRPAPVMRDHRELLLTRELLYKRDDIINKTSRAVTLDLDWLRRKIVAGQIRRASWLERAL